MKNLFLWTITIMMLVLSGGHFIYVCVFELASTTKILLSATAFMVPVLIIVIWLHKESKKLYDSLFKDEE